jgi:hypothetical protein
MIDKDFEKDEELMQIMEAFVQKQEATRFQSLALVPNLQEPIKSILLDFIKLCDSLAAEIEELEKMGKFNHKIAKKIIKKYHRQILKMGMLIEEEGGNEMIDFASNCIYRTARFIVMTCWEDLEIWDD